MPPASRGFGPQSPLFSLLRRHLSSQPINGLRSAYKVSHKDTFQAQPKKFKQSPIPGRTRQREDPEESESEPSWNKRQQKIPPHLRRFIGNIIIAVPIIAFMIIHRPVDIMTVTGGSMRPLFNPNSGLSDEIETRDRMLVFRLKHTRVGDIEHGEIVVFKTPHDPEKFAVKRVVALAGDKVLPLPGYEGSEEEQRDGVVIPYNHMWVEGDVDDRSKSVDSNWYGPISQNLVVGRASALLTPWYRPRWIRVGDHTWPAEENRRVQYSAVEAAKRNPNDVSSEQPFVDGRAPAILAAMQSDRARLTKQAFDPIDRRNLIQVYKSARAEVLKRDPATVEVATSMTKEIETAFYRAGGGIEHPLFPELRDLVIHEVEVARQKQILAQESMTDEPEEAAKRTLDEMRKETKRLEEAVERAGQHYIEQARQGKNQ